MTHGTNTPAPPARITQTLYVEYHEYSDTPYRLSSIDMDDDTWPVLGTVEVTVDLPAGLRDPVAAQLDALAATRERIAARAGEQLATIDDKMARLQAIEYQGDTA